MFLLIPASLVVGFVFYRDLAQLVWLVPWLFAFLTLVLGLGGTFRQLGDAFRKPLPMLFLFGSVHIVAPFVAFEMGAFLFGPHS
ncbi:MAG TPA: bile acid:sodium symporter family protein, partial [Bacilli bacterium]